MNLTMTNQFGVTSTISKDSFKIPVQRNFKKGKTMENNEIKEYLQKKKISDHHVEYKIDYVDTPKI